MHNEDLPSIFWDVNSGRNGLNMWPVLEITRHNLCGDPLAVMFNTNMELEGFKLVFRDTDCGN
jgi:hypothetical protein